MSRLHKLHKLRDPEIRAKNVRALGQYLYGLYWDAARPAAPDPIFVIGCSRSGTTVTYETIAASPQLLKFGYEIPQFWNGLWGPAHNGWESEAAYTENASPEHRDATFRYFFQRLGQGRVLDKTCINILRLPYLNKLFPNAMFVFIQRDGRDNVSSLMDGWRHHGHFGLSQFLGPSPEPVAINGREFREWSFFLPPGWRDYNQASLEQVCAYQWITANRMALEAKRQIPPTQWIHLRYEDLFERPLEMFEQVFERLGLVLDDSIRERCSTLDQRPTSIVKGPSKRRKWREHNREAIERVLDTIRPMMTDLGYDADA